MTQLASRADLYGLEEEVRVDLRGGMVGRFPPDSGMVGLRPQCGYGASLLRQDPLQLAQGLSY